MTANKLEGKARELIEKWRAEATRIERKIGRALEAGALDQCADELAAALDTAPEEESRAITALKVTLFEVDCYLPASIAKSVQKACDTARQHEIRDHEHQHSCSYYCDRPECMKAQRDELREAYVVRQSGGEVDADEIFRLNSRLVEETNRADRAEAELAEYKKSRIYISGYKAAITDMKKHLDSKQ